MSRISNRWALKNCGASDQLPTTAARSTSVAWPSPGARKNTHIKDTKWKVASTPTQRGILSSQLQRNSFLAAWTEDSAAPCRIPQTTKVQLAPCQRPPRVITSEE